MDWSSAGLLVAAVFAITEALKKVFPALTGAALQVAVLFVGLGSTFLVAFSDYGKTQVVGNIAMNNMNIASLVLIGLMIGGGATILHQVVGAGGAIRNIGQNQE